MIAPPSADQATVCTVYDHETGAVLRVVACRAADAPLQIMAPNEALILGLMVDGLTHRIDLETLQPVPLDPPEPA